MKNNLIVVYYYRNGKIDWNLHLKLYMSNWKAYPTGYVYKKELKNITPKQALRNAIIEWKQTTGIDFIEDDHSFSVMIPKTKNMFVGLRTVKGKKAEEYVNAEI